MICCPVSPASEISVKKIEVKLLESRLGLSRLIVRIAPAPILNPSSFTLDLWMKFCWQAQGTTDHRFFPSCLEIRRFWSTLM
jgi:hypothetical protein